MLSDNEFGDIVKAIEERNVVSDPSFDPRNVAVLLIIDQAFYDDCELNIVEFLHASLSARGHVLHDRFDMEFRKNGSRTQTSHRLSRERVAGMLEPIGAYVDADDIFIRASHHDDRCISFEEFLRIFREARSKTLLSKIDGEIISMTSAVSVAQETKRAPKAGYTGNHLSFDMVERLGGNSSVIIEISTKSERGMADEHPTILHDGHRRVLKVFRLNQFNDVVASKVKCELMQELKTLQKMRHTGIVRIHDVSQHFSHIRVTEELCRGGTLRDRVPLTESRAARITGEILAALSYMHSQKIVHQALSLTSVMFVTPSEDSPIKLISLGHSHKCQPREEMVVSAGDWWRLYTCSPEIISGHHFTEKSDMWSVGVIAFALISGYVPFSGR
jgi:tRNA A-37 threonylcarbamoyl transferase component Bud32